jgi:hypothetical protein
MSHPLLWLFATGLALTPSLLGQQFQPRVVPDFRPFNLLLPIDLDGDGTDEMLAINSVPSLTTFRNDGHGNFAPGPVQLVDETWSRMPQSRNSDDAELLDMDGDGDLDLIIGSLGLSEVSVSSPWGSDDFRPRCRSSVAACSSTPTVRC